MCTKSINNSYTLARAPDIYTRGQEECERGSKIRCLVASISPEYSGAPKLNALATRARVYRQTMREQSENVAELREKRDCLSVSPFFFGFGMHEISGHRWVV